MFVSFMSCERRKDLCVPLDVRYLVQSTSLSSRNVSEGGDNDIFYGVIQEKTFA